jgi:hypothetical protein
MSLHPQIDQALDTVRHQICPRCPYAAGCVESDLQSGRQSRCTIFRHLPNVMRIAASRDPMLSSLPETVQQEIGERHAHRENSAAPDTLFQFRDELTQIVTPILERRMHNPLHRMHEPLHRMPRRIPEAPAKTCSCTRCTCGRKPPESFLG